MDEVVTETMCFDLLVLLLDRNKVVMLGYVIVDGVVLLNLVINLDLSLLWLWMVLITQPYWLD